MTLAHYCKVRFALQLNFGSLEHSTEKPDRDERCGQKEKAAKRLTHSGGINKLIAPTLQLAKPAYKDLAMLQEVM